MFKPVLLSLAVVASGFASSAAAETRYVIFVDGGFYPEITYLDPGDIVTFTNEAEIALTAEATDQSWSTGSLPQNSSYSLPITETTVLTYSVAGDPEKAASFSFDLAPLSDVIDSGGDAGQDTSTN